MPTIERTVVVPYLDPAPDLSPLRSATTWAELLAAGEGAELRFEQVPFDHPLWVLYSSGTTGLPKAIVQGHGGILLEHLKKLHLHVDAQEDDRIFWFTTTGWMMWNFLVGVLLTPASIVLYDGSPGHPDMDVLWDLAEQTGMTCFGTSASYVAACMKAGVEPSSSRDLERLRAVGSTGSPLSPEGFEWVYEHVGRDTWLFSTSGGTDVCTAFVGGVPLLPVYRGELQGRSLGAAVEAFDEQGNSVVDQVGELVITEPMPSMPLFLWGDEDGSRYRASYFEQFPGVWRHGDWIEITSRGTAVIYGRSDSTINRQGVRMGTSEIYRAVQAVPEVLDALVVDVPRPGTEGWMPLFVVLEQGVDLDERLADRDQAPDPRAMLAPPRPRRGLSGSRGAADAERQGARGAREEDPHRNARRAGGEPRLAGQPRVARLLRRPRRKARRAGLGRRPAGASGLRGRRRRRLARRSGSSSPFSDRKASTTSWSNWLPARAWSSALARFGEKRPPVGPVGGHRRVGVGDRQDPSLERDLVLAQAARIAAAVGALVVAQDPLAHPAELGGPDDAGADLRVPLQLPPFLVAERRPAC